MNFSIVDTCPSSLGVSVVVPVFEEAGNVPALAAEIDAAMANIEDTWECLWVDDGSQDATVAELGRIHERSPRHRFIRLDGNYGQSAALGVGFSRALGELIVMLDGDAQNDPADIPRLIATLHDNDLDVVNGFRNKQEFSAIRRISSRIANGFRNRVTRDRVRDVGCSLRVFRRQCVDGIIVFHGMHRFLPTLIRMNGFERQIEVPVNHRPRLRGRSKYGIGNRLWVGLMDTFGVRWLGRRMVTPRTANESIEALDRVRAQANNLDRKGMK